MLDGLRICGSVCNSIGVSLISLARRNEHRSQGTRTDQHVYDINKLKRGGTGAAYLLRRLARERPDLLDAFERGAFKSARAAAIAAGIVKPPTPLNVVCFPSQGGCRTLQPGRADAPCRTSRHRRFSLSPSITPAYRCIRNWKTFQLRLDDAHAQATAPRWQRQRTLNI